MFSLRPLSGAVFAAVWVLFSAAACFAADPVSLDYRETDRLCDVEGSFEVKASPSAVWDVLTGYERLPQFVENLKRSHVEKDLGPYHFLLEQEFEGGFLFITQRVRVLLDVHETWHQQILFEDIDHKDFSFYKGSWELRPGPGGILKVLYSLRARRNFDAPLAGDYMKGGLKNLLDSVRKEILRRQALEKEDSPVPASTSNPVRKPEPG
jgi:hypothetical protein